MRTADWLPYSCGDKVRLVADPRHEGEVTAVRHGARVVVKWDDTGWKSDLLFREVELVTKRPQYGPGYYRLRERLGASYEDLRQQVIKEQLTERERVEVPLRDRRSYKDYPR